MKYTKSKIAIKVDKVKIVSMSKQDKIVPDNKFSIETIKSLITDLGNNDMVVRVGARKSLVTIGEPTVDSLIQALTSKKGTVRLEATKALDQINIPWKKHATEEIINVLIADLGSNDGIVRVRARKSLVAIGKQAVGPLLEVLVGKTRRVRWEAAKAIGQIGDPTAAPALVKALEDGMFEVRWLAAEALITIGKEAVVPLLQALLKHSSSTWLRDGAHRVLHDIGRKDLNEILQPVVLALEGVEPSLEVPIVAWTALKTLKTKGRVRSSL